MSFLAINALRISILLLAALCSLRLMRGCSAAMRHAVLSMAILFAPVTPIISLWVPSYKVHIVSAQPVDAISMDTAATFASFATTDATASDEGPAVTWQQVTLSLWLLGVVAGTAVFLGGIWRLSQVTRQSRLVTHDTWVSAMATIRAEFKLRRRARLRETTYRSVLVTWGLFRPQILLPPGAAGWPSACIAAVMGHEMAHVRRMDWPIQITAQLLRVVLWFNPFAWMICSRLRRESEYACDDLAITARMESAGYAGHLLAVARELNGGGAGLSSAIEMADPCSLERRFEAMLNSSINRRPVTAAVRLYIVAALLVLAAPLYALQSSTTVEVPELRALPGHAVPERSEPYMVSQAVARQATSRLLGTVTDNTGNALAGMTIFLSEPFTVEQVNRIQMARRNREAAESDLNSERDKFDRGVSTVRLVLEAEHRLAQAKTDEADIAISVFGTGAQTAKITQTDNAGGFVITGLQPGRYGVRVFSSQTGLSAFANVDIRAGQDLRQDFQIRTAAEKPIATTVSAPLPSAVVSVALELPPPTVTGPDMRAIYTPPRVYSKVDVLFPPEARKVGFQGTEVVRAMIRVDGTLKVQEILQSLDEAFAVSCRRQISEGRWRDAPYATAAECPEHIGFDNAATDALNQWRFAPGVREGVPVTTLLNVRVDFSLR